MNRIMEKESPKVHIIGAGVSGLIAAKVLETHGLSPVVLEASNRVGGRLKTDLIGGYQLDQGFQVLLSSYPEAKKHLNYKDLNLQKLKAGACIFIDGKPIYFGDPLRDISLLFPTIFSGIGTFSDKLKIARLNFKLKKKSIQEIFNSKEYNTIEYLKNLGFSSNIIDGFFKPFFNGIFLETELQTSSRMFEFAFKMFGDGFALLPMGGIEEIPKQLKSNLNKTKFQFGSKVKEVNSNEILLENGDKLLSDYTIIATEPSSLIGNLKNQRIDWKSCQNLYFRASKRKFKAPFIGLIPNDSLINNIFYPSSIPMQNQNEKELLSVTVIKLHQLKDEELVKKVKLELEQECGIKDLTFLKIYNIPKALPKLNNLQYEISASETKLKDGIFLAGDVLLNGSLNAAMIAGEKAAEGVLETMEKSTILG